jgi:hypothetical protein
MEPVMVAEELVGQEHQHQSLEVQIHLLVGAVVLVLIEYLVHQELVELVVQVVAVKVVDLLLLRFQQIMEHQQLAVAAVVVDIHIQQTFMVYADLVAQVS